MHSTIRQLPPGQEAIPLRPFGFPAYVARRPDPTSPPVVTIRGEINAPVLCDVGDLTEQLGRRHVRADLHCVATWSATGLEWSGVAFADFWSWLGEVAELGNVGWLLLTGADGWRACLSLPDALAPDVLLADRLDGHSIPAEHGAPLRLVAPAHYGYKSVKHLSTITLLSSYQSGSAGWGEHPRARVAREERSRGLPGWAFRRIYRALAPRVFAAYDRQTRKKGEASAGPSGDRTRTIH
jgi:DMSO/TMAO reductase YedYZ molybdopterin-dependent catalytic subunit